MKKFLLKVWKVVDTVWSTFLKWCGNKGFTFFLALVIAFAAYFGADPISGVPEFNVCVIAWLAGTLTPAVLLVGTSIVKSDFYDWRVALYGAFGALAGVLCAMAAAKLFL